MNLSLKTSRDMAFYSDELSPIDRGRILLGKASELPDVIKNRRQWKSLVLGKKDPGMNSFATIAEEREEEISSDGSHGKNSSTGRAPGGPVTYRKITFPKPRKYIASRLSASRKGDVQEEPHLPLPSPEDPLFAARKKSLGEVPSSTSFSSKPSLPDLKVTAKKSRELVPQRMEFLGHYAINETPFENQWNEALSDTEFLTGWPKPKDDKPPPTRQDASGRSRQEDKWKTGKPSAAEVAKAKRAFQSLQSSGEAPGPKPTTSTAGKARREKSKGMNMKDVVNVYKNLAYGSKDEIKSFVEKLSYVKDDSESDKNMVSVMNLKVLENKIKSIAKKTAAKSGEASAATEKKTKAGKLNKRSRKAHIDRLARHKVVKVPAMTNPGLGSGPQDKPNLARKAAAAAKNKEPWKYVGMQSALDKTYFVYPSYPLHSEEAKKAGKKCKGGDSKNSGARKPEAAVATARLGSKVKRSELIHRSNLLYKGRAVQRDRLGSTRSANALAFSASSKSMNRPSATTVCNVQFRPAPGEDSPAKDPDPGLLLYLHGTQALNVKCPYADKQFSRVKFFRKAGRGTPLIRGLARTHRSGRLSREKQTRVRSIDLLDFDEDIENITEFLRSQNQRPSPKGQEQREAWKKSERDWPPRETPRSHRRRRRPPQAPHHHHQHQHGTRPLTLSPDSVIADIAKQVQHLQYLPDTEDNRKIIGAFFQELDRQIEARRISPRAGFSKNFSAPSIPYGRIPILGY